MDDIFFNFFFCSVGCQKKLLRNSNMGYVLEHLPLIGQKCWSKMDSFFFLYKSDIIRYMFFLADIEPTSISDQGSLSSTIKSFEGQLYLWAE